MLKKIQKIFILLIFVLIGGGVVIANSDSLQPKQIKWNFDGVFGTFDRSSVQRGLQVYREVCSACHSLDLVPFRSLLALGFSEAEVKEIAKSYSIKDGPNDQGEMFERPGVLSDYFPPPYANEQAARASNNGALPPDQSLIIRAREDGANYVYSLLTGFNETPPAGMVIPDGMYYNPYFPGDQIAMAPPLSDNIVQYTDGTKATVDQMARDVVDFLQWASDPTMEARKRMGVKVMMFLIIFTILFAIAKHRIWSRIEQ